MRTGCLSIPLLFLLYFQFPPFPLLPTYLKVGGDSSPKAKRWEPLITAEKKRLWALGKDSLPAPTPIFLSPTCHSPGRCPPQFSEPAGSGWAGGG